MMIMLLIFSNVSENKALIYECLFCPGNDAQSVTESMLISPTVFNYPETHEEDALSVNSARTPTFVHP